ncbi:MAG: response regulator [Oscillospiraceae bacterium]|nr:response regulator [Oscillospiraceae bacterium]
MNILIADGDACALSSLCAAVQTLFPTAQLHGAASEVQALEWAASLAQEGRRLDYLFCETVGETLDGLALARRVRQQHPQVKILFCTASRDHAFAAMSLYARGYLLKPVTADAIGQTLDAMVEGWRTQREECGTLQVRTFGYFEAFADGKRLTFGREKAKELLAYLIDRHGASVTTEQIAAVLWEDKPYSRSMKNYVSNVYNSLRRTLEAAGCGAVLIKTRNHLSVDAEKIRCDAYDYERGEAAAVNAFHGEYMSNYSWAEFSAGKYAQRV